jgi:hypothetical protein
MDTIQLELPLDLPAQPPPNPEVARQIRLADGRSRLMAELYRLDGREDPGHPLHGVFTGLGQEFHLRLGMKMAELFLADGGDSGVEMLADLAAQVGWIGKGDA